MKQKQYLLLLVLLLSLPFVAHSQKRSKFLIVEAGFTIYGNNIVENDFIRDDMSSSYYESYNSAYVDKQLDNTYAGIKLEIRSHNNKFGFIGGIRYTQLNSSVTKKGAPEYFYFLYQQTSDNTEYFKIKSINEKSTFLGVPVEFRYFPLTFGHNRVRLYATAGFELAATLATKNSVDFYDPSMSTHEKDIVNKFKTNDIFYASFQGGVGLSYGMPGKMNFNFGVCAPAMLGADCSSLVKAIAGGGVRIQILVPLTKAPTAE